MTKFKDLPAGAPVVVASDWDEEDHPRDEDGKFTDGGGGGKTYWGDRENPANENPGEKRPRRVGRDVRFKGVEGWDTRHGDNDNDPPGGGPTGGRRILKAAKKG